MVLCSWDCGWPGGILRLGSAQRRLVSLMDDALSISLRLLLVVALVLLNGLFVAAEFSIVAVRRSRIADPG